jgi:hypothetical protein
MKKWVCRFLIAVTVVIGSVGIYQNCYLPEFEIVSTIKSGSDNFTSVYLTVQVNRWLYDETDMEQKIIGYYCDLNGEPNNLVLSLL